MDKDTSHLVPPKRTDERTDKMDKESGRLAPPEKTDDKEKSPISKALKKQRPASKKTEGKSKEEMEEAKLETQKKMKELRTQATKPKLERKFLAREAVLKLLPSLCEEQDYKFRNTEIRNVLLVGRSRSGKTTAVRTLRGAENVLKPHSIFSATKNVNFQSFSLQGTNKLDYTFNIIDTPGLFEVKKAGQQVRTDEQIMEMISDCLKNEITKIHCIVLFCSVTAGVNNSDIIAMQKLIDCFGTQTHMAICVTQAENMDEEARDKLVTELDEHTDMAKMLKLVNHNVYFMGAVDSEKMVNEGFLKQHADQVMEDRLKLLEFLFLCVDSVKIDQLQFVATKRNQINKTLQEKSRLMSDLCAKDLKDETLRMLAQNTILEVNNLKHMVSLFDTTNLEVYAKVVKEKEKLSDKVAAIAEQTKKAKEEIS